MTARRCTSAALALTLLLHGCQTPYDGVPRHWQRTEAAFEVGTYVMGAPFVVALAPVTFPLSVWLKPPLRWGLMLVPLVFGAPLGGLCAAPTYIVERECYEREDARLRAGRPRRQPPPEDW